MSLISKKKENMNSMHKNLFATMQKVAATTLCIVFALLLMVIGCKTSFEDYNVGYEQTSISTRANVEENPYYFYNHEGKKVYLTLNTEYVFLSVNEPKMPAEISKRGIKASEFRSDNSDKKQYKGEQRSSQYWAEFSLEKNLKDG